jgi:hypothetical protein
MSGSGYSSEVGMQLSDMSNYLITKGLGHLHKPMWWLNGLINEVPEGGQTVLDQAVGMGIMHEMRGLQEHIYFGRMDDEQSVVESLLEMHQSVRRWNPRILALDEDADADSQKVRRSCIGLCSWRCWWLGQGSFSSLASRVGSCTGGAAALPPDPSYGATGLHHVDCILHR